MAPKFLVRVRDLIVKDWGIKALALLLGAVSFYSIRASISFEITFNVPVSIEAPPGMAVLDKNLTHVNVAMRGSQEALRQLDQTLIRAVVRPRETDPGGAETIPVRSQDISGVQDVRIVSIRPAAVRVTYDWEAERDVVVLKPKTVGSPLFGRVEVDYEPKSVRLRGPRLRLRNIGAVSCETVDVDGRVESFSRQVRILSPGDAWVYEIEPDEVTVHVNIVTELITRHFEGMPIFTVTQPGMTAMVELEPPVADVHVVGRSDAIENLSSNSISVYVNCVGLAPGAAYELPVQIQLPADTDLDASTEPEVVRAVMMEEEAP